MKKRLMSLVLVFAMIFTMLGSAVPAFAANIGTSLKIEADKTEYYPGDIITYTLTLGPTADLGGLRIRLDIPEGLTYVEGSGKETPDLSTTMNAVKAEFTQKSKIFIFLGETNYSNDGDTELMTLQCKVNDDCALGQVKLGLASEPLECFNKKNEDIPFAVSESTVNVIPRPVKHTITALQNEHGTVSADYDKAFADTKITLNVQPDHGYHFDAWNVLEPEGLVIDEHNQFIMPDAEVTVGAVIRPDLYTVTIDGVTHENIPYDSKLGAILPEKNPTLEGHTFVGWMADGKAVDADTVITGPMEVSARYTTNDYVVTVDDGAKKTEHTVKYDSKLGDILPKENPTKAGHTFAGWYVGDEQVDGQTPVKGNMTVEAQFSVNRFTIIVDGVKHEGVAYGTALSEVLPKEDPTRLGYTFVGWFVGDEQITREANITGPMTINSKFTPNTDTKYTVNHMLEDLDGEGYTLIESQPMAGTTDAQTAAEPKTYEGFTAPEKVVQTNIAPDGSAVVEIRYTRNSYTVQIGELIQSVKYEDTLTGKMPENPTKIGYTFAGWFDHDTQITEKTVVKSDIKAQAHFTANTDTKYTVRHMWENIEDDGYTLHESVEAFGTTDTMTAVKANEYEGFTAQEIVQKNIDGDGNAVVEVYYTRNVYTVNVDDWTYQVKHGDTLARCLAKVPVREGYTFLGWFSEKAEVTAKDIVTGDMTIHSDFYPNPDTKYEVRHLLENLEDDGYMLKDTQPMTGTTDTLTNAQANEYEGFTVQEVIQKNIAPDGSTVVEIRYTRNTYTVTVDGKETRHVKYDSTLKDILPENPTKVGYTFNGWMAAGETVTAETHVKDQMTITSQWIANSDTKYEVHHLLENLTDNNFTVAEEETQTLTGTTDTQTAAEAKSFEGFTVQPVVQQNIKGDGSTVVEIRYTRNTYTVVVGNKTIENVKYGTSMKGRMPEDASKAGYTFNGWFDGDTKITVDTVVTGDITAKASFTANENTKYVVKHLLENLDNDGFTVDDTQRLTGTTDTLTNAQVKTYEGFTAQPVTQQKINGDGSTVIEIKYIRNTYTVTVDGEKHEGVKHGTALANILPNDPVRDGQTFSGWYVGDMGVTGDYVVKSDMTIESKWDLDTYTVTFRAEGQEDVVRNEVKHGTLISDLLPEEPVREGYTFQCWLNGDREIGAKDRVKSNLIITAKFKANIYTVTFQNEGHDDVVIKVNYDETIGEQLPKKPVKVGYTFVGWFDGDNEVDADTKVKTNMTVKAEFKANTATQYTVKHLLQNLDNNSFTVSEEDTQVLTGTTDTMTAAQAKSFEGFTAQSVIQQKINGDGSTVIEIKYVRNTYTVTVGDKTFENVKYGTSMKNRMPEDAVLEGHTFVGWFDKDTQITEKTVVKGNINAEPRFKVNTYNVTFRAEGQENEVIPVNYGEAIGQNLPTAPAKTGYTFQGWYMGDIKITEKTVVKGNITVEARYQINAYNVTFQAEGQNDVVISVNYGETIGKLPENPVKEGYTFQGWYVGDTKVTEKTVVKGGMTATAKFKVNSYDVTFRNEDQDDQVVSVNYGDTIGLRLPKDPVKEGYTFVGWFDGDTEITEKTVIRGAVTAEAKFVRNSYEVTFQVEGKTTETVSVNYGDTIGELPKAPVKEGYTFVGWFDGDTQITGKTVVKGTMTVTAKFKMNSYDVTFRNEGQDDQVVSVNYGDTIGKLPKAPVKEGYTFVGWFDGDTEITEKTVIRGAVTAEAKFVRNSYEVTFQVEGKTTETVSVNYGDTIGKLPKDPVKEGYTFVGWFDGDTQITGKTVVKGTMTVTAKFQINTYTVTIDGEKHEVDYGTQLSAILPKDPVKEGHTFVGWFAGETQVTGDTLVENNMIITARFNRNAFTVTIDGEKHEDVANGTQLSAILPEAAPKAGHTFVGWFSGEKQVSGDTVVNGDMTITGKWEFNVFTDVKRGDWFYEGVRYTTFNGLFSGVSGTEFGPFIKMNRAMVVQVLYSMSGKPDVELTNEFKDVPANQWYAKAVAWAVKEGVASGYGNGMFGSEDLITREQLAVMLYSYAKKPAVSGEMNFADADEISSWAKTAMQWAVENGIMSGVGGNKVSPKTNASRAEAAVMMMQFDKKFGK